MISGNQGLRDLRNAYILYAIAESILFAGFIMVFNSLLQLVVSGSLNYFSAIINGIIVEVVGGIVGLIGGIFSYKGFRAFPMIKGSADVGSILVIIGFVIFPLIGLVGLILGIVGFILMKSALDKIGDQYGEELIKHGAILSIFPIISIIGCLLTSFALNRATVKQPIALSTPSYQPMSSQMVEQVGLGIIKGKGEVILTLNSKVQGTIVSAKIENSQYLSVSSIPITVGVNNIVIDFGAPISLVQSSTYPITLVISTGYSSFPITVYAIYYP